VDGILDLRCSRCLTAVILGSDTFPKELKVDTCLEGIGIAAIRDMLRDIRAAENMEARSDISFSHLLAKLLQVISTKKKPSKHKLSDEVITATLRLPVLLSRTRAS
jgi:hypothetical protein